MKAAVAPLVVLAALIAGSALAAEPTFDQCRLEVTDLPRGSPRFEDYPARPQGVGGRKAVRMDTPDARMFRTRLRAAAKEAPNFAGRYVLASWGCGTSCVGFAIIDPASGVSTFTPSLQIIAQGLAGPMDQLQYRVGSRLLVATGLPNEDEARRGVHFYVWTGKALKLVRSYRYADLCRPDPPETE